MTQIKETNSIRYNLTYDVVFKETFTSSLKGTCDLLNKILNENIKEDEVIITSNELLGESVDVKNSLLDIRLNVLKRLDINLEMQRNRKVERNVTCGSHTRYSSSRSRASSLYSYCAFDNNLDRLDSHNSCTLCDHCDARLLLCICY